MKQTIAKTAGDPSRFAQRTLFYGSAREGMGDLLTNGTVRGGGVLLPAFIGWSAREGSGVFDPVRESGSPYGFYGLNADLSVDVDDLAARLAAGRFAVLVVIHYYGRTEPRLAEIKQLADEHGALLVEDLAHGYFTAQQQGPAGSTGDVLLYSLHKMLPLADGGQLVYRDPSLVSAQAETRPDLARVVLDFDWRAISVRRRENYLALERALAALPGAGSAFHLLWPELSPDDVPQTLPVYVHGDVRDALYESMNESGYGMVSLYHTLIPEVREGFPVTADVARHIINFPVHQDVPADSVEQMAQEFGHNLDKLATNPPLKE